MERRREAERQRSREAAGWVGVKVAIKLEIQTTQPYGPRAALQP